MKSGIIVATTILLLSLLYLTFDRAGKVSAQDIHSQEYTGQEETRQETDNRVQLETHKADDHTETENAEHDGYDHIDVKKCGDSDDDHSDYDDVQVVKLSPEEMLNLGISTQKAGQGRLKSNIILQGEVRMNGDHVVRVVPRVPGIVKEVKNILGDKVKVGDVMAVLESKELADARADFHASAERLGLAKAGHAREERLWKKKITSEQEYLDAKQALVEAQIKLRLSEQKLIAMGMPVEFLKNYPHDPDESFTLYNIVAPFDGTVIEKDITLGEVLAENAVAFVVANLDSVWVDLSVYQKDLPFIRQGQQAMISAGIGVPDTKGTIAYVGPLLEDATRRTLARIILPNPDGLWRPGLFVTAQIIESGKEISVMIPKLAIQKLEDKSCIFIKTANGFKLTHINVGRIDKTDAEIISGLKAGQIFVTKGAFELKAKIVTSTMDSHAGHGH